MSGERRPDLPKLVVLTPVYNEAEGLEHYASEVRRVLLDRRELRTSVLFIDDGSTDSSWTIISRLSADDPRFRGIRLSRNFGSHTALSAGFANADEDVDALGVLACDLQDPPEIVLEFVARWKSGADIVWGARKVRKDAWWRRVASRIFAAALRRWAMPRGSRFTTGSFLLMDRRVLAAVRQMREHNRVTFALVAWTGFDQDQVVYERRERAAGASGWTAGKMFKAMYDAFVGFSMMPIRLMTLAAVAAFVLAGALVVYVLVSLVAESPVPGWTSQMFVIAFFFAIQFSISAIMGEYLYRIYAEAVGRPLFFVSEETRSGD